MQPVPGDPDERILAIYRDTIDTLYRYVSRHCGGDRALAEDVTQETWLRAVREWRRTGPPDQPIAWLTTVARNLLVSYFRRRQPAALDALLAEDALAGTDEGRGDAAAEAQMRAMEVALRRLRLDLEEINVTSAAPRNELHARVSGRRTSCAIGSGSSSRRHSRRWSRPNSG
jgi:RNA polymerase sigma factor (sigma-70 family)